jgi:hypothetical protein
LAHYPGPAQLAALVLAGTAPDAGVLVGDEGELETIGCDRAFLADGFRFIDLSKCRTGGAHREEQIGTGVAAR